MLNIVFLLVLVTASGPITLSVPSPWGPFGSEQSCQDFGEAVVPIVERMVRNLARDDMAGPIQPLYGYPGGDVQVTVSFHCAPAEPS